MTQFLNLNLFPFAVDTEQIAIFIPIIALLIPIIVVPLSLYFKFQRQRLWHETARIALEKGQPIPLDDESDECESRSPRPRNDFRAGLILIAVSVGLSISPWWTGSSRHFGGLWFGSAIPGCIGIALLINAFITAIFLKKNRPSDDMPPLPSKKL